MTIPRHLLNIFSLFILPTRLFGLKRWIYTRAGVKLGSSVKIGSECRIYGNGKIVIGDNSWLGIGVEFYVPVPAQVKIGSDCDIAPGVRFFCGSHSVGNTSRRAGRGILEDIHVGSGVWLGAGSMLLPGTYLENGIAVAAGSVVTKGRYPANSLLAVNPARVKKVYEQ
jgi:acetyltransferase-like isoleucine patch superfamily enzyme